MTLQYNLALLHLRQQTHGFVQALGDAARAAQELDSADTQPRYAHAERTLLECAELLRTACAHIPGARELLALALDRS
jgi:hypothetical protein